MTMSRMSNRRPSSPSGHVFTRRHVLGAALPAVLGVGVPAAWPGLAQASPIDPDGSAGLAPDPIRAQDDPNFHPVKFRLPAPAGRKGLWTTAVHLVARSLPNPTMPSGQRELMISLWYPAGMFGSAPFAKYM